MKFNFWKESDYSVSTNKVTEKYFISNCEIVSRRQLFACCLLCSAAQQSTSPVDELMPCIMLLKGKFRCAFFTALRMDLISFNFLIILMGIKYSIGQN